MSWTPKEGRCELCGRKVMLMSSSQKYCPDCRETMKKVKGGENRKILVAKRIARRRGTDPDRYAGKDTECRYKKSCYYGGDKYCEFLIIEGHSRLFAGYPIVDGKCGAYKRGRRKGKRKPTLPVSGSWNIRDLSEV